MEKTDNSKQDFKNILSNQLEYLSEMEHMQWQSWVEGLIKEFPNELPKVLVNRWKRNCIPYNNLSEKVKDKDRKWAKKIIIHINEQL